jgi:hypothetical protein
MGTRRSVLISCGQLSLKKPRRTLYMNEFSTYEFVVAQKREGKIQLFRILAVVSYVLFFCVVAAALILLHFPWMVAVLPIFEWMLIFFTWRYRSVEFEYSMTSGNITFSYIYGGRSRKTALETAIKRFQEIAPLDDAALSRLEARDIQKEYRFISSDDAPDIYYALLEEDGELSVVLFEATQKALGILRFYNPLTVVTKVSR